MYIFSMVKVVDDIDLDELNKEIEEWMAQFDETSKYWIPTTQKECKHVGTRWDWLQAGWVCMECGKLMSKDTHWSPTMYTGKDCECGSQKTYGVDATHADYCPKYVKPEII